METTKLCSKGRYEALGGAKKKRAKEPAQRSKPAQRRSPRSEEAPRSGEKAAQRRKEDQALGNRSAIASLNVSA